MYVLTIYDGDMYEMNAKECKMLEWKTSFIVTTILIEYIF